MIRIKPGFILPVLAAIAVVSAAWTRLAEPAGPDVTVTGMVVDLACKFNRGQSGPTHLACAEMCAKAGVPFGILTSEGKLYIPAAHGESSNAVLMPFLEQEVTATGATYPAAGNYTIEVSKIAKKS
jgi:hypothetical protein